MPTIAMYPDTRCVTNIHRPDQMEALGKGPNQGLTEEH
jgi:hypothetical protein